MKKGDPAAAISRAALDGSDALAIEGAGSFDRGLRSGSFQPGAQDNGDRRIVSWRAESRRRFSPSSRVRPSCESFLDKGRMRPLVEAMPVHVVTNDKAGLLGAARCAAVAAARLSQLP